MAFIAELAEFHILAVVAFLVAVLTLVYEVSYRIGRATAQRRGQQVENVGAVVATMLTLTAFVLGITLSVAIGRFGERRMTTLEEANAIGTAWLRSQAIEDVRAEEIGRLLERHAQLRLDFVRAPQGDSGLEEINRASVAVQDQIWARMTALAKDRTDPIVGSLMSAVNEAFDAAAAMRYSLNFPFPPQLNRMFAGMGALSVAALGFQMGLRGSRVFVLTLLMTTMWCVVVVNIYDIASARLGTQRTGTSAYEWTIEGMRGSAAPPGAAVPR